MKNLPPVHTKSTGSYPALIVYKESNMSLIGRHEYRLDLTIINTCTKRTCQHLVSKYLSNAILAALGDE